MSHHWNENEVGFFASREISERQASADRARDELLKDVADIRAKMDKRFPHGQLDPADHGKFRYNVSANPTAQIVRVDFGAPVSAIGLTLAETEQLIEALTEAAFKLRGISS